eukprot:TRINITY_DN912_c1_g3_i1.p2 TRINITY_DN912_c1_g3~~TRINITY_DN912_c1_g3_i1.p2  ORF type:complete len:179 (+),score=47.35 TRINITY_DN912_c1_g3_i1:76-612(+)
MGKAGQSINTHRAFGKKRSNVRKAKAQKAPALKKGLVPGSILILLAGRFRGRRVVFLKQLQSGLLLVTGPYAVNGVPLRRVNQRFCIVTSAKADLKGADYKSVDDSYFAREDKEKKAKKSEGAFFAAGKERTEISQAKKDGQKKMEDPIVKGLAADMKGYLKSRFSLTANMHAHELKF